MKNDSIKRIFDFTLALVGVFISLPLWFILAIAIWAEDRGVIFYAQDRVGKDGKLFGSLKFRSMVPGAEEKSGPVQSIERDPRVTRIGRLLRKTAMDELPQLWNILKGQMSFVGPRALRPQESDGPQHCLRRIDEFIGYKERSSVIPGLTGVAQILAPRDISREDKFKYDIWYIQNRSFSLDIELIFLSFIITFLGRWESRKARFKHLTRRLSRRIDAIGVGVEIP